MRAETEIYERRIINVIYANRFAAFVRDQLTLQRLVALGEDRQGFCLRDLFAAITQVALGDVAHALFNHRQVFVRDHARRDHVVEETIARVIQERRADAELRAGKEIEHGRREQVRRRMAQDFKPFARLRQHRFNLDRRTVAVRFERRERAREINLVPVDTRSERLLRRIAVELLQSFADRDGVRHLRRLSILQLYVHFTHGLVISIRPKQNQAACA